MNIVEFKVTYTREEQPYKAVVDRLFDTADMSEHARYYGGMDQTWRKLLALMLMRGYGEQDVCDFNEFAFGVRSHRCDLTVGCRWDELVRLTDLLFKGKIWKVASDVLEAFGWSLVNLPVFSMGNKNRLCVNGNDLTRYEVLALYAARNSIQDYNLVVAEADRRTNPGVRRYSKVS